MTGGTSKAVRLDPQMLMKETDRGFKVLTARLNKVVYSQGVAKIEPLQEYTYSVRPHCGVYM